MSQSPWAFLGVQRGASEAEIRRAYAARLKAIDVEVDPDSFMVLRAAFEKALGSAGRQKVQRAAATTEDDSPPPALLGSRA